MRNNYKLDIDNLSINEVNNELVITIYSTEFRTNDLLKINQIRNILSNYLNNKRNVERRKNNSNGNKAL